MDWVDETRGRCGCVRSRQESALSYGFTAQVPKLLHEMRAKSFHGGRRKSKVARSPAPCREGKGAGCSFLLLALLGKGFLGHSIALRSIGSRGVTSGVLLSPIMPMMFISNLYDASTGHLRRNEMTMVYWYVDVSRS